MKKSGYRRGEDVGGSPGLEALGRLSQGHTPELGADPGHGEAGVGLIKDWAFLGDALPTHWSWHQLGTAHPPSVAFPDEPVLGVGLCDSSPSPGAARACLSCSLSPCTLAHRACLPPRICLRRKGSCWGEAQVVSAPHTPGSKAPQGSPLGIRAGFES